MIEFPHNIGTVFIMLGFSCNFRCKYCLQHEDKKMIITDTYNPDIIDFLRDIARKQMDILNIHFFGGEPLLYFNVIKQFVSELSTENVHFSIITNGSLITKEVVDFFNDNDFHVTISWDGQNSSLSRGVDVFTKNRENIFSLKNGFSVSGVINKYNSVKSFLADVSKLDMEYKQETGSNVNIGFNLDCLYNYTLSTDEVYALDYKEIEAEMQTLTHNYIFDNSKNTEVENFFIGKYINSLRNFEEYTGDNKHGACSNGVATLNLDLEGNLYLCHNDSSMKLGDIYTSIEDYMAQYNDKNKIPQFYNKYCKTCSVRFLCDGGCMLCSEEFRLHSYCTQKKAFFNPIITTLLEV